MARLTNPKEMERIFKVCKDIYDGKCTQNEGVKKLHGKTIASDASLKMYFVIYSCMRQGKCYKKGTSASFTQYLLETIYSENGTEALYLALASAKQNAEYRKSCDNEQPGIEAVCRDVIAKYNLSVTYEGLDYYFDKGIRPLTRRPQNKTTYTTVKKAHVKNNISQISNGSEYIKVTLAYEKLHVELEGDLSTVNREINRFFAELIPEIKRHKSTKPSPKRSKRVEKDEIELSLGHKLIKEYPDIIELNNKLDFKAKMIPLMYLVSEQDADHAFTVKEIKSLFYDALGKECETKEITKVFSSRPEWFDVIASSPKKYKLLDVAKDYARSILAI